MITDAIISAFLSFVTAILTLLPSGLLPTLPVNETYIGQYAVAFNRIVPLQLFVQCVTATIAIQIALWAFDGVVWVYHQVHGSN